MKLTQKSFELLAYLATCGSGKYPQKFLAEELGFSVGMVNKIIRELQAAGLVLVDDKTSITEKGIAVLEPYRVKRAIILAAGISERLAPVSLSIPKPLVEIRGKRIIDTLIDALITAGIENITVVVGYRAEMFSVLKEKYPNLNIIENPRYNESGNITTLYSAGLKAENTYICDADLYIHNAEVIQRYEYSSCFFGVPVRETDDWCFSVDGKRMYDLRIGGRKCCKAVFIAYLDSNDSEKCQKDIEQMINSRGGKEHYWFDVLYKGYNLAAKECYSDDITEIDTMDDLLKLDRSYLGLHL